MVIEHDAEPTKSGSATALAAASSSLMWYVPGAMSPVLNVPPIGIVLSAAPSRLPSTTSWSNPNDPPAGAPVLLTTILPAWLLVNVQVIT